MSSSRCLCLLWCPMCTPNLVCRLATVPAVVSYVQTQSCVSILRLWHCLCTRCWHIINVWSTCWARDAHLPWQCTVHWDWTEIGRLCVRYRHIWLYPQPRCRCNLSGKLRLNYLFWWLCFNVHLHYYDFWVKCMVVNVLSGKFILNWAAYLNYINQMGETYSVKKITTNY
jgi:hypothetical protein